MVFVHTPVNRPDIALETYQLLDSSGDYDGPWIERPTNISSIRVLVKLPSSGTYTVTLEEGLFDPDLNEPGEHQIHTITVTGRYGYAKITTLTARYFRLRINGTNEEPFWATIGYVV